MRTLQACVCICSIGKLLLELDHEGRGRCPCITRNHETLWGNDCGVHPGPAMHAGMFLKIDVLRLQSLKRAAPRFKSPSIASPKSTSDDPFPEVL